MSIRQNILSIQKEIPDEVTLIAVSKTKPLQDLEDAYECGMRDFGENKVQELMEKYDRFHKDVRWHLIGHLQTNKVKYLVGKVHLIHSLDSIKLLHQIEKVYSAENMIAKVLIQINIGKEESKTGIFEEDIENIIEEIEKCNYVKALGIMVIIPKGDVESNRLYFRKTKGIWNVLSEKNYKNVQMEYLSMGMTKDYKTAIEEGSNMVRIGEGIFGQRIYN
ncbi:YggS family pyridoxal phosphate-dependent enzyme [Clostridium sp. 'White wine YQ']|uniref:YggS family pyridoxal phosphate-dependent enzyme n=1 Tax=Clostridium sp. 'White wine YQ' TaxID=3027474 RepID=UPI002365E357|nr:YggS family pyridoxal phosphate-dependent enzyme [Clostridium sp. 'White wine YQ']MDD7793968.1 YggS family pyridoxal phosphate-dependent enzyme [Clostridium sp. 'White wine YQ']